MANRDVKKIGLTCEQRQRLFERAMSRWAGTRQFADHANSRPFVLHRRLLRMAAVLAVAMVVVGGGVIVTHVRTLEQVHWQPDRLELTAQGREAVLVAKNDRILHRWTTPVVAGIRAATLVREPDERGGRLLAVLGFTQNEENPFPNQLCAFDTAQNLDTPVWAVAVEDDDIPVDLRARPGRPYAGRQFRVATCEAADVFPEVPGQELVVVFQHDPSAVCSIRVVGADGHLLFQAWHDGNVRHVYWLAEPGLIVCRGLNAAVRTELRGLAPTRERVHPFVLFAIMPENDAISPQWVKTIDHPGDVEPAWYRCLFPSPTVDLIHCIYFDPPLPGYSPKSYLLCSLRFETQLGPAALSMVIDAAGNEVPHTRTLTDIYNRALKEEVLPSPDVFQWGDLPPIQDKRGVWLPGSIEDE